MTDDMNKNNIGTIKILFYSDCPHFAQTTQDVKSVLIEEGLSADIQSVDLARAPDVEKEMPFAGSPTILINGADIAPAGDQFRGPTRGNCRLYDYKGKVYDYPPKELIREALTKRSRHVGERESITPQSHEEAVGEGELPAAPEHDLDYHDVPRSAASRAAAESPSEAPQKAASGAMPAAPEHDLDYHRESETTEQPREKPTERRQEHAEDREEGPEEIDIVIYDIETVDTDEDENE